MWCGVLARQTLRHSKWDSSTRTLCLDFMPALSAPSGHVYSHMFVYLTFPVEPTAPVFCFCDEEAPVALCAVTMGVVSAQLPCVCLSGGAWCSWGVVCCLGAVCSLATAV